MKEICTNCYRTLTPWSKFKDIKEKEGVGLAICSSIINGVDYFWSGESRSRKHRPDYRTLDLYFCQNCKAYFLKCPGCNTLIKLSEMPKETRTMVACTKCKKSVLYADGDYSMGGG